MKLPEYMNKKQPVLFLSHGGGPWPWMMEEMPGVWDKLFNSLTSLPASLPMKPAAILLVTAHWIESEFCVSTDENPGMIYDYGGFPPHTYKVVYPARGSSAVGEQVAHLANEVGVKVNVQQVRGFDHGTFCVTQVMYPNADVPVIQMSIKRSFSPDEHIRLGRALTKLRDENILIVGSGLSFHNLGLMGPKAKEPSMAFDKWLQGIVVNRSGDDRNVALSKWEDAPFARVAHPREDHLIPLMVAVGAAEDEQGRLIYHEENVFGGWTVSAFRFGI